jgi:hypothetical protein
MGITNGAVVDFEEDDGGGESISQDSSPVFTCVRKGSR